MSSKRFLRRPGFSGKSMVVLFVLALRVFALNQALCSAQRQSAPKLAPSPASELPLKGLAFKIVYESYRKTNDKENWELYLINADGSGPVNLTRTGDVDEMYPHASPDGSKVCFVADETVGGRKYRRVYYMNIDGSGRVKVADDARQPCWSPDSKTIAYLPAEFSKYTIKDYATKGITRYDLKTGWHIFHPNRELHHLYNICWSFDGKWFLATVHGGMGFKHANLLIEADGPGVYDLTKFGVTGCRPDFRYDNKMLTWGLSDWDLCVAEIDLSSGEPNVTDVQKLVKCDKAHEVYHSDFSPDGKYLAFSHGPKAQEMVGGKAPGWNICVSDMTGRWVQITRDGNHNKEPDWVPVRGASR